MLIVTAVLLFRNERILIFQGFPNVKKHDFEGGDKYIVCVKNEVLNGNKSAVIKKQKEFTEIYHFKA